MEAIILTSEQFDKLSTRLEEIKNAVEQKSTSPEKIFIDNQEFVDLMKISPRTAQKWRDDGTISFSQIGNKIYYRMSDIQVLLDKNYKRSFSNKK